MSTIDSSSIGNIQKENTSKIINRLEMGIPSHFQIYSDLCKEYLHTINDIFGICILLEKKFFEKLNIDPNFMKNLGMDSNYSNRILVNQTENYDNYLKGHFQMRISGIKPHEQFMHMIMNSYSKTCSNLSKNIGN